MNEYHEYPTFLQIRNYEQQRHCFSHQHTKKVILHSFKDKHQNYITAPYSVRVNE